MSKLVSKQTQGRGECRPQTNSYNQLPTIPTRKFAKSHLRGQQLQKRWVPRRLLAAQGFFEGQTQLWLPVEIDHPCTTNLKDSAHAFKTLTAQKWVSKSTLSTQGYYEGQSRLWVPKHLTAQSSPHKPTNFTISTVVSKICQQKTLLHQYESPISSDSITHALEYS